jgi:uncharacterized phiE125 gp8 family phage protein
MYQVTVEPAAEPVTTAEAKAHLRVTSSDDDTYIGVLIQAAREMAEVYMNRAIVTQTIAAVYDEFKPTMKLPFGGCTSIVSITYLDDDGQSQTASTSLYGVDTVRTPAVVYLKHGQEWPSTYAQRSAVTVTYLAGAIPASGSPTENNVPARIKQAILMMVADLYENREAQTAGYKVETNPAVQSLLYPLRQLGV